MIKQCAYLWVVFLMLGCSGKEEKEPEKIFEHQVESIDKARQVEDLIMDRVAQQKKEMDKAAQ